MGCKVSKSVAVREDNCVDNNFHPNTHEHRHSLIDVDISNEQDINVFNDTQKEDEEHSNPCDNAKPRLLKSAIRRTPMPIQPFIDPDDDNRNEEHVISSNGHHSGSLTGDPSRCSDSGFGNTSQSHLSYYNSETPKSPVAGTPSKSLSRTPIQNMRPNGERDLNSRPDSGKTSSILTTSALNASFATTADEDFPNCMDVSLDLHTPFSEYTDVEDGNFRTLSITPSIDSSLEPTPIMHNKRIGVIQEESEGGFTPRSVDFNENVKTPVHIHSDILPKYRPREVLRHNKRAGFRQWHVYQGKVYDVNQIRNVFAPIVKQFVERKSREEKNPSDGQISNNHDSFQNGDTVNGTCDIDDQSEENIKIKQLNEYAHDFENSKVWNRIGMLTLTHLGLDNDVINMNLPTCCVGHVILPDPTEFWDEVRTDVNKILELLNRADAQDQLTVYARELKEKLESWVSQYNTINPSQPCVPEGDPNKNAFPLPPRIHGNADSLRNWMQDFVQFDTEIPESGAWVSIEAEEKIDLGDPDELFKAILRSDSDEDEPFDHDIDDEAAWHVVPLNLVADDVMTYEQEAVEISRRYRTDLDDPERMERRRKRLLYYFASRYYDSDYGVVAHFERWARAMEDGDRQFKDLCDNC